MALRIYYDNQSGHVVFRPSNVDPKPTFSLHAYANDLGTIDILATYTLTRKEVANFPHTDVLDIDGNPAGGTLAEVVDYLNSQFEATGGGAIPVITSPLTSSVVEGLAYLYTIEATNTPSLFLASGLPEGLVCNPVTGVISGVTSVLGPHNILISAINAYGGDSKTLVLTVEVVGGYHNTYSVKFKDHIYQHFLAITSTAAIDDGSNEPWSISTWLYVRNITTNMDIFAQGDTTGNGYRHVYMDNSGRIVLKFYRTGNLRTYRTQTSLTAITWTHLTMVYAADPSCTIYFDGVAQAVDLVDNTLVLESKGTANMRIGRGPGVAASAYWMDGFMDEWAYWNVSLSAGQVALVYNGGSTHDLSLLAFAANLRQWLLMGDGDSYPTINDNAVGGLHPATMTNMTSLNIVSFTP